jgi:hypothetical protein
MHIELDCEFSYVEIGLLHDSTVLAGAPSTQHCLPFITAALPLASSVLGASSVPRTLQLFPVLPRLRE